MQDKRLWIVALTTTGEDGYISTTQSNYFSETAARDCLAAFKKRCIKTGDSSVAEYATEVSGKVMKVDPDYGHGLKYIPTGGLYCGSMTCFDFDPDDLDDTEHEYEVELTVTRINTFCVTVTALSEDDAETKVREEIEDGDHEHELDTPDDFEIEIESVCEA